MRELLLTSFAVVSIIIGVAETAKILALFPFAGPSQYIAVERYLKKLAERGHEMTVVTSFPQKTPLKNFRDIKVTFEGYDDFMEFTMNCNDNTELWPIYREYFQNFTVLILEHPEMQRMLSNPKEQFDLIIVETIVQDAWYALGAHFNAHLIGYSSFGADPTIDSLVGNESPLSYIPSIMLSFTSQMNFWQRLQNFCMTMLEDVLIRRQVQNDQRLLYEKYFPHLQHLSLSEIRRNFSLILLNQHFSLSFARPYVPNMVEVGGMHINHEPKPLPEDIEKFIDGAKDGVIYFSLGSNVKGKFLSQEKLALLLRVFGSLKQRVLWKFENPELPGKPENVFISKWFPQADILAHSKVKLFITHFGLLSTMEALFHGKPLLGFPVFFDQFYNLAQAKADGYGLGMNLKDLNESELRQAIDEMLNNPKYSNAARKISARYHDQPMKPLDKAIFWTEYVLRHNGAEHMRVAGRHFNFFQLHCLDCVAFILSITIAILAVLIYLGLKLKKYLSKKERRHAKERKKINKKQN